MRLAWKGLLYGLLSSTFAAPIYFWPGLVLGLRFLSSLLYGSYSFLAVSLFGFGYWFGLLYWSFIPLKIAGLSVYYPLLIGVIIVPFAFGLQFALPVYIARFIKKMHLRYVVFLTVWALIEFLRSLFFPFYPISFSLFASTMTSQLFAFIPVCLLNIILLAIMLHASRGYLYAIGFACASVLFTSCLSFSKKLSETTFALVQPSIAQTAKNTYLGAKQMEYTIYCLSALQDADFIIWPEAAMPSILDQNVWHAYQTVASELAKRKINEKATYFFKIDSETRILRGSRLLIGLNQNNLLHLGKKIIGGIMTTDMLDNKYYNSLVRMDDIGQVEYVYDKQILIPFGEYVPARSWLFGYFNALAAERGDYSPGFNKGIDKIYNGAEAFHVAYLICYESLFKKVLPQDRFDLLIHLSNDAWFGDSACLNMHFDHMKLHAIRNRVPALRCVNTGITALIDPYGRVLAKLDTTKPGVLIARVMK